MSTLTVYSDTADGYIDSTDGATTNYATARNGSGSIFADTNNGYLGQQLAGITYACYVAYFSFDTSSLGASVNVTAADLSLYVISDSSATDFTAEARLYDWGASLTTADWNGATLGDSTLLATLATSGVSTSAYNTFTDTAFPANINKTGTTRICVGSDRQRLATTPTTTEFIRAQVSEAAGTTQDPRLVVTYTGDATVTPAVIAATASFPTASPSGDANVTPDPIGASAAFPAGGVNVSAGPQPITCVATFPQASLFFDYVVTPATLAGVASFPQAGVDVVVGASVLAALASFPSAGVSVSVGPSAIAVTASFPAATVTAIFSDIGFAVSVVTSVGKSTTSFTSRAGATSTVSSAGSSEAEVLP